MRPTLLALVSLATLALSAPPLAQRPLMAEPAVHSTESLAPGFKSLADALTSSRQSSLYYDYIRTAAPAALHAALGAAPPAYTTLLVPTNSAILNLARRPHQGPPNPVRVDIPAGKVGITMLDEQAEEEARERYLAHWLERHAIQGKVDLTEPHWEGSIRNTLDGGDVYFSLGEDGQTRFLNPGRTPGPIEILDAIEVDNGMIFFLAGSLSIDDDVDERKVVRGVTRRIEIGDLSGCGSP